MTIQLKTEKTEMVISTLGAEPQSLKMDGREYIWSGNPDYWFRRAPLLFPMIGPTPGNRIAYLGREYDMPNNGFARDTEFTLVRQSGNEAVFRLEDSEKTRKENYYQLQETGQQIALWDPGLDPETSKLKDICCKNGSSCCGPMG